MFLTKDKSGLQVVFKVLACLILGAGLFGWGYWQGHRGLQQKTTALAAGEVNPGPGNKPTGAFSPHPTIPANATPEMKEFLQNQATLSDKMEQLRKQSPNGAINPQVFAQFRQQNADLLKQQSQLAQVVAQQQSKNTLAAPPSSQIPSNASPQMQAYLAARDKLMRDQIAFMNQHGTDSLPDRQAAMQQWRQENASRFQQLEKLAQALVPTPGQTAGSK